MSGMSSEVSGIFETFFGQKVHKKIRDFVLEFGGTNSITKGAKKTMAFYQAIFSNTIEYDLLIDITKDLELRYAVFTLMNASIHGFIEDDENMSEVIQRFSTEGLTDLRLKDCFILKGIDTENDTVLTMDGEISDEAYDQFVELWEDGKGLEIGSYTGVIEMGNEAFNILDAQQRAEFAEDLRIKREQAYKEAHKERMKRTAAEEKAKRKADRHAERIRRNTLKGNKTANADTIKTKKQLLDLEKQKTKILLRRSKSLTKIELNNLKKLDKLRRDQANRTLNDKEKKSLKKLEDIEQSMGQKHLEPEDYSRVSDAEASGALNIGEFNYTPQDLKVDMDKARRTLPTIINIKLVNRAGAEIRFNLSIKVVPHIFHENELQEFITDVIEHGHPLHKLVKLSSREISFWKDFVVNEQRLERDKRNYKKYNVHPWFRQMTESKYRRKARSVLRLIPFISAFIQKGEVLPTATIVVTQEEFEDAFGTGIQMLIKRPEKITRFMDQLMLLGIVIVDNENSLIYMKYSGFEDWEIMKRKELLGSTTGKEVNNDLVKIMNAMLRRM